MGRLALRWGYGVMDKASELWRDLWGRTLGLCQTSVGPSAPYGLSVAAGLVHTVERLYKLACESVAGPGACSGGRGWWHRCGPDCVAPLGSHQLTHCGLITDQRAMCSP